MLNPTTGLLGDLAQIYGGKSSRCCSSTMHRARLTYHEVSEER